MSSGTALGGGIACENSSQSLTNCTVNANQANAHLRFKLPEQLVRGAGVAAADSGHQRAGMGTFFNLLANQVGQERRLNPDHESCRNNSECPPGSARGRPT